MSQPQHSTDRDCRTDSDDVCRDCGVWHGDPCPACGGRGYHVDDLCPELYATPAFAWLAVTGWDEV